MPLVKIDADKEREFYNAKMDRLRNAEYEAEADPLFFKFQRGEITKKVWLDKVAEIKARHPKRGKTDG